jgi:hypothetical protein
MVSNALINTQLKRSAFRSFGFVPVLSLSVIGLVLYGIIAGLAAVRKSYASSVEF